MDFLEEPARYATPALSPDGSKIAYVVRPSADEDQFRLVVADLDVENGFNPRALNLGERPPLWVRWANDDRILAALYMDAQFRGRMARFNGLLNPMSRVYSIDANLQIEPVILFGESSGRENRANWSLSTVTDYLPDDPDHVLMPANSVRGALHLWRVNLLTGEAERIERGNNRTRSWYTVDGVPMMRVDISSNGRRMEIHSRPNAEARWQRTLVVRRRDLVEQQNDLEFEWAGTTETPGEIYVRARRDGSDFMGIHRYDLETGEFLGVVAERDDYDIDSTLVSPRTGAYLGHAYMADRRLFEFANPEFQAHYLGLLDFFGNQISLYPTSIAGSRMVMRATGPTEAGAYYLYDFEQTQIDPLFAIWQGVETVRTYPVEAIQYPAADGTMIEGFVTWPVAGPSPDTPLIVMPHGGPEARDVVEFDTVVQFFATEGYAVFQPNFRGSYGYGESFIEAGHGEWGGAMQTDIHDGVRILMEEGLVDPDRACIVGFSYGGYAALSNAANWPETYKCVVAGGSVTNLAGFIEYKAETFGEHTNEYWFEWLGDPADATDRAAMDAISPVNRAAEIQAPVLLYHGAEDRVVSVSQTREMAEALAAAGVEHRYIEDDEGYHNWGVPPGANAGS